MKKKQIIGLGTLLLVLLLGSFTTSYAMSVSQAEECMQYITDQYNANYTPYYKVYVPALIDSNLWTVHKNDIGFDTYNTIIMRCLYESAKVYVDFVTLDTDNTYINNAWIQFNTSQNVTLSNVRVCRFIMTRTGVVSSYELTTKTLYYNSLYRNPTDQSVWCAAVIQANNIVNISDYFYYGKGYTVQMPFTFIPKAASTYADVWTYEDVPFYDASGDDLYIGQLFVPLSSQTEEINSNFYWQYNTWNFRSLSPYCTYLEYVTSENDTAVYDVYLVKEYIYENTLYDLTTIDKSTEPYGTAPAIFYIRNNYTVVTNGALDPSSTFSGDYKDKYDDDLQNQQDVNNISEAINDTINQPVDVSGELAGVFSGDLYNIAEGFGFDSTESIYFTFIEDFLRNVCNVLLDDSDAYFDFSLHGEEPTRIYSSDIGLPSDHPLRIFISIILVFLTVYLMYFQFMKVFELIQTSSISDAINSQDINFYMFRM